MFRYTMMTLIAASLFGLPVLTGCDRELEHKSKVEVKDDGTVKKQERTVTESPSGTVTEKETKSVDRP